MRRLHFGLLAAGLPVFVLSLALVGCGSATTGSADNSGGDGKKADGKTTDSSKKGDLKAIDAGKGTITGKVTLKGAPPALAKLTDDLLADIDKSPNKKFCMTGKGAELEQQGYRIKDGNVENVFVWLQPVDKTSYFKVENPEKLAKTVNIDQPHCAFIPHAAVLFSSYRDPADPKKTKPTGQKVVVHNSAPESHNTNYKNESGTVPGANKILQSGDEMPLEGLTASYNEPIKLKCNIHGWMDAYLWDFDHPYAALTAPDGTYKIENVPTGVKMKIVVWHEKANFFNNKGEEIEVKADAPLVKNFELEAAK